MSELTKLAVVFWQPQINRVRKEDPLLDQLLKDRENLKKYKTFSTPDEKYVTYYWDWEYIDPEKYRRLMKTTECIRNAYIVIRENGDVFSYIETEDSEGCDGEFEQFLSWRVSIDLNSKNLI